MGSSFRELSTHAWRNLTSPRPAFPRWVAYVNLFVSFWVVVSIFFFCYFGTEIERSIGRVRMAVFLVGTAALVGLVGTVIDLAIAGQTFYQGGLTGLSGLGLLLALVFINIHMNVFK